MKAYQLVEWGREPEFLDVPVPQPGPGEVLVRMKGAGLCRSDLDIMDSRPGQGPYANVVPQGFTLGHENAGIVEALGANVVDLKEGDAVVVHHIHSCGYCPSCLYGVEQSCVTYAPKTVPLTRGVGIDGGLATYLKVPRHELVSIGSLDPVEAAPLTDAGVTAYRAIANARDKLRPGSTAVLIGIGGLGNYAVQLLKLLTHARVIAVDTSAKRLALARQLGADATYLSGAQSRDEIFDTEGFRGADVVIDFVGTDSTLLLASRVLKPQGKIVLVGMEGGSLKVGWGLIPTNSEFTISMGSTRADLYEICQLAAAGKLRNDVERFAFDRVGEAYGKLRQGALNGRAVVVFD